MWGEVSERGEKTKVLLIPPSHHYKDQYPCFLSVSDFPAGFGYLAASLARAGHEVNGLNPNNIVGYPSAKFMLQDVLIKKLKETKPDLIGLGGLCTDYAFLRDAIAIIQGQTTTPIILGGQIVSNDARFIFDNLKPDYAITGEADEAIVELADTLEKGIKPAPFIAKANVLDLDTLPFPDYEPFGIRDMLDNYSMHTRLLYRYSRPHPRVWNIVASRSCPFTCTFCIHGRRDIPYRARSIPNIMEEIRVSYEKYQFNILILLDELFAVTKDRMNAFSDAVIKGKQKYGWDFDWMFQTHASARLDLDSLKLAKKAGCFLFSYGLESASPTVLQSMNKKLKPGQVVQAIELAWEAKVGFAANLIFGDPAETTSSWAESLRFWLEYGQDNMIFLATLMPYPGSQVFEHMKGIDKKQFYEHIDEGAINLTTIPSHHFGRLLALNKQLEEEWLFVKMALNVKSERESTTMYQVWATCPHCGEESFYRQNINQDEGWFALGTGCVKCNRRIGVIIPLH